VRERVERHLRRSDPSRPDNSGPSRSHVEFCIASCVVTLPRGTPERPALPGATVPSFVPTTKPYRVRWSVAASRESLAGQGIYSNPSQLVTFRLSCWLFVRPVLTSRRSQVRVLHCPPSQNAGLLVRFLIHLGFPLLRKYCAPSPRSRQRQLFAWRGY
jgi:hypothetical protein